MKQLIEYIKGVRKGKEAHRIEKEAMRDPFLFDALEGYDGVKGTPIERIERMKKQISARTQRKQRVVRNWSMAASLLIGLLVGTYFLWPEQPNVPQEVAIATTKTPHFEEEVKVVPPADRKEDRKEAIARSKEQTLLSEKQSIPEVKQTPQPDRVSASKVMAIAPSAGSVVRGKIISSPDGEPLIGVNVRVKGTNQKTITNIDGEFELTDPIGNDLEIAYIGMESITIPPDTSSTMLIAMNQDQTRMDEVVVVAMGTKKSPTKPPKPAMGMKAYKKYLKKNLIRPADGECSKLKGKVEVSFGVDSQGRPVEVEIKKGLCTAADEEAMRLVKEGPAWNKSTSKASIEVEF